MAPVAAGDLTASEAADLAKVVDIHVQALATAAFEQRLARLEGEADTRPWQSGGRALSSSGAAEEHWQRSH